MALGTLTIALSVRAVGRIDGRREPWWTIEAATIPSKGAEGWRKGRTWVTPGCCARPGSIVVALRTMTAKPSETLTCPVLVVG